MFGQILHFGAMRTRVVGSGNFLSFLRSFDNVKSAQLPTITLAPTTNLESTVLANFVDQRAQLEMRTSNINEYFVVSKIIILYKPLYTQYSA
jgi:hypothetical protein